jgi:hypothetical protein
MQISFVPTEKPFSRLFNRFEVCYWLRPEASTDACAKSRPVEMIANQNNDEYDAQGTNLG